MMESAAVRPPLLIQKCGRRVAAATLINVRAGFLTQGVVGLNEPLVGKSRRFIDSRRRIRFGTRSLVPMERLRLTRVAGQAAAWVLVWMLVFYVLGGGFDAPWRFFRRLLPVLLGIAAVVFVNGAVLLPNLYFQRRRGWYVAAGAALVIGVAFALQFWWTPDRAFPINFGRGLRPRGFGTATLRYLLPLASAFLGASLLEVMRYASYQEQQVIRSESEHLSTEIKFLKSQVNPHFLFNSLNNIYTLTLLKDDKAPESLLRLSGMLRYMLYDSETETVPLGKEIEYIRSFIALKELKDSRGLNVTTALDESRPRLAVAPLLLIPFVENAFKHSCIEDRETGYIDIRLVTAPDSLTFTVVNSVPAIPSPVDKVGGIGLDNVRKRLELHYPGRHRLDILREPERFRAELQITLS